MDSLSNINMDTTGVLYSAVDQKKLMESINTPVMERHNTGKNPLGLIPTSFTRVFFDYELPLDLYEQTGLVLDFGAKKYSPNNWRKGGPWIMNFSSLMRHIMFGVMKDEKVDPESKLPHWGHIGCNLAFLLEFQVTSNGTDDRFIVEKRLDRMMLSERSSKMNYMIHNLLEWQDGGDHESLVAAIGFAAEQCAEDSK